jgi:uncharacterized protein (DUF4415 family)
MKRRSYIMGTVSFTPKTMPQVSQEEWDRAASVKEEDIDYSDIPEIKDLSGLRLVKPSPPIDDKMYKPLKVTLTCRLDSDIVAWLKKGGRGYQTRLNAILRRVMTNIPTDSRKK